LTKLRATTRPSRNGFAARPIRLMKSGSRRSTCGRFEASTSRCIEPRKRTLRQRLIGWSRRTSRASIPSIYTHSITWAAYGKEKVKGQLKLFEGSLADRLDVLVRACNRNQTVGIPIGPETSRILAEIVSSRIDDDLRHVLTGVALESVDRLQDDWFIGMPTLESSETVLSHVVRAYREYGLDINGSKTSVTRVIQHLEEAWKSEIGAFLSHRSGDLKGARLREFLALTLRLQSENAKQAVTNYALTVLENQAFESGR